MKWIFIEALWKKGENRGFLARFSRRSDENSSYHKYLIAREVLMGHVSEDYLLCELLRYCTTEPKRLGRIPGVIIDDGGGVSSYFLANTH